MDPTSVDIIAIPVVEIELSRLSSVCSPRTSGEDPEHVETLLSAEGELPPILVHRPTMQVIDGLHLTPQLLCEREGDAMVQICPRCDLLGAVGAITAEKVEHHGAPRSQSLGFKRSSARCRPRP